MVGGAIGAKRQFIGVLPVSELRPALCLSARNAGPDSRWLGRQFAYYIEGHLFAMSSIPPLQCLFCQHLNPAGASFCNDCGSQLNLQPCDRCGAIDNRTATNCYKCGAAFTLPAAPGLDSQPAPAMLDHEAVYPALNNAGVGGSPVEHQPEDPTPAWPEPPPVAATVSSELAATATGSRRRWRVAVAALVLGVMAMSAYEYFAPSAQRAPTPGVKQPVPGEPMPAGTAPSAVAPPIDAALTSTETMPKLARGTDGPDKAPALAPPGAGAALAVRPAPATDAEVKSRQTPPIFEDCPQAVAALGLCNPDTKQEKP